MSMNDTLRGAFQRMFRVPGLATEITYKRFTGTTRVSPARSSTPAYTEFPALKALKNATMPGPGEPQLTQAGVDTQNENITYMIRINDVASALPFTLSDVVIEGEYEYKVRSVKTVLEAFVLVSCNGTGMAQ